MNSTKDQRVSSLLTSELVVERRLQHRQEREKACRDSETADQMEERLRKRRMRYRARHTAQTDGSKKLVNSNINLCRITLE